MNQSDTILVLGASGLIGRALVKNLKFKGYKQLLSPSRRVLDLRNKAQVESYFASHQIDYVIVAAGKVGGIQENINNPIALLETNLQITQNIVAAAHQIECKKTVLFGSSCMYPKYCQQPMSVQYLGSGEMEQSSIAYATAKMVSLQLARAYNAQYKKNRYIFLIPNSAYGPGDNFNPSTGHVLSSLIARFVEAKNSNSEKVNLWGTGKPIREFVFSEDIADAVIFILEKNLWCDNFPINIGSGVGHSITELAEIIKSEVGYSGSIIWDKSKPDGSPKKILDSSFIKSHGWLNGTDIRAGIKATLEWYLAEIA